MALYKPGALVSAISGNVGAVNFVASSSRPVLRTARRRVNTDRAGNLPVRAYVAHLNSTWRGLTTAQRNAWATLAAKFRWTDRLAQQRQPSGRELFMSHNIPLMQCGYTPDTTSVPVQLDASYVGNVDVNWAGTNPRGSVALAAPGQTVKIAFYAQLFYRDIAPYLTSAGQLDQIPVKTQLRFIKAWTVSYGVYTTLAPNWFNVLGASQLDQVFIVAGRIVAPGFYSNYFNWAWGTCPAAP